MTSNSMADSPSHFFKIILPQTLEDRKLSIPEKFVRKFGDGISAVATLRVSNSRVWHVGLSKDGRRMWFNDGWHEFLMYHSIIAGYFLVFRYEGNSDFHVLIFDMTACEIAYPSNGENVENHDKQKYKMCTPLSQQNQAKAFSSFGSTRGIKRRQARVASSKSPKFEHSCGHESRGRKCNMEELAEINESKPVKEWCRAKTKFEIAAEPELLDSIQDKGIYVAKNFGFVSETERERAINVARSFKSKNPSFMAIIRARNLDKHHMYVPANFTDKYLSRDSKYVIKLEDSDGKVWPVHMKVRRRSGGSHMTTGWCVFTKEKKLGPGDIVVFELIRKEDILLKVSIFHSTRC